MATALTNSIAKDGQTTPTGNLPMGGYNHTNVANATLRTQYASAGQVQDGSLTYLTSVSGTDTITAVGAASMSAYVTGQVFTFIAAGANTGAATLNINSIGAKPITKNGTTALAAGDLISGAAVTVFYDGTEFQITDRVTSLANVAYTNALQTFTASQRGTVTTDNDLSFDMSVTNNFSCTPTGSGALTFTNITAGQSGYVLLDNSGGYAITAAATTKVGTTFLSTVSTAGVYLISYMSNGTNVYCTASGALS